MLSNWKNTINFWWRSWIWEGIWEQRTSERKRCQVRHNYILSPGNSDNCGVWASPAPIERRENVAAINCPDLEPVHLSVEALTRHLSNWAGLPVQSASKENNVDSRRPGPSQKPLYAWDCQLSLKMAGSFPVNMRRDNRNSVEAIWDQSAVDATRAREEARLVQQGTHWIKWRQYALRGINNIPVADVRLGAPPLSAETCNPELSPDQEVLNRRKRRFEALNERIGNEDANPSGVLIQNLRMEPGCLKLVNQGVCHQWRKDNKLLMAFVISRIRNLLDEQAEHLEDTADPAWITLGQADQLRKENVQIRCALSYFSSIAGCESLALLETDRDHISDRLHTSWGWEDRHPIPKLVTTSANNGFVSDLSRRYLSPCTLEHEPATVVPIREVPTPLTVPCFTMGDDRFGTSCLDAGEDWPSTPQLDFVPGETSMVEQLLPYWNKGLGIPVNSSVPLCDGPWSPGADLGVSRRSV